MILEKKCARCKKILPASSFYKDRQKLSGLTSLCKECGNVESKARFDKNKDARHKTAKEYRDKNKEKISIINKKYHKENPEVQRRATSKWCKNHRDAANLYNHNRRVKMYNSGGDGISIKQREELMSSYLNRCAYCGKTGKLEIDHIVPISNGGEHSINNAVPACRHCNSVKNNRSLLQFMVYRCSNG